MKKILFVLLAAVLICAAQQANAEILDLSICEIQEVPVGQDSSLYEGDTVRTSGIVTAGTHLYYAGTGVTFYMQNPDCGDLFSGIMAYNPTSEGFPELFPGDSVTVVAVVSEYEHPSTGVNMTELFIVENGFTFHSYYNPEPQPLVAIASYFDSIGGADSLGEGYEGVLTTIEDLSIDSVVNYTSTCTWICHDTSGIVYVREASDSIDNGFRPQPGTVFTSVTGVLYHRFGLYHLQPRYMRDFSFASGAPIIAGTSNWPPYPMPDDGVEYESYIFDPDGEVDVVFVNIRVNIGEWVEYEMDPQLDPTFFMYLAPAGTYQDGDRVDYYITAYDDEGNEATDPYFAPISFYTFDVLEAEPMTIAQARIDEDEDFMPDKLNLPVEISGIVTATAFSDTSTNMFVQDASGGINVYFGPEHINLLEGDSVTIRGVVDQYNGKAEVVFYNSDKLTQHGMGTMPEPMILTCADLNQVVGEQVEGWLVKIERVTLIADPDTWPLLGESANMTITDATGSAALRIERYTDIDGNLEPTSPMHITGVVGQYDYYAPYDSNYQLMPRKYTDFFEVVGVDEEEDNLPKVFALGENYPNPFNPTTVIKYALPRDCNVDIAVYDIMGRRVKTLINGTMPAGIHEAMWDGDNEAGHKAASGVYFYKMNTEDFSKVRKMALLK
ncbi:MAG: T9SS type A sorting domain-containing protein [candidate division Zixibacteria bacterium]|nr:T9SS type A sorting domain-containing protein [candidate division Zixibacteria bacterium]